MSLLTDAEHAYRQQRAAMRLVGERHLCQAFRRARDRAEVGSDVEKARLKALRDEFIRRGLELPRV